MMAGIFALADVWASVFWLYHNVFAHPFSKYTVNTYAGEFSQKGSRLCHTSAKMGHSVKCVLPAFRKTNCGRKDPQASEPASAMC